MGAEQYIDIIKETRRSDKKTDTWVVVNRRSNDDIGIIRWYGAWRQYCYFPGSDTIYNKDCMRYIADFCDARTRHRGVEVEH